MKIIAGCATDKGPVRAKNQDRIICNVARIESGTMAVACICDGVGSYEYSEIASEMVTEGIMLWFESILDRRLKGLTEQDLLEDFEATIRELNELVYERKIREQISLGCTMSVLLIVNLNYYIFHVGDSRIYVLKDSFCQITHDEISVSEVDGVLKQRLTNCVGKDKTLWVNRLSGMVETGDVFMLGSDGLFKRLREEDIRERLARLSHDYQARRQCREFIQIVESRGERDNISCAILKVKKT